ncbi:MAG: SDR family NAD(P)-dependent oxidoreductase [Leucobacter sp.]
MTELTLRGLRGKHALVTGATDGLGKAIADALHAAGCTVYGTSRSDTKTAEICERYGSAAIPGLDLADSSTIPAFVRTVNEVSGGIDFLINNAGINIPKTATDLTDDDWSNVFDTNVKGTFVISREFGRSWLADAHPGSIVNIASQAGVVAIEERAAYGSSKAAMIHLTKQLALEWAPQQIRVNSVAPTFVRTALTASTLERGEWAAELRSRIPLDRFGEPGEIAGPVLFLLSDLASLITGHTLVIDGGYTIR